MSTTKKSKAARIVIFAIVVIGIIVLMRMVVKGTQGSDKYVPLAQCMVDKGVSFYGAFWCPHCQAQERSLGMSRQKLESMGLYKECSTANGSGQLQQCTEAKIESYPTWVYEDGFKLTSDAAPTVCEIQPGPAGQPAACASYGSRIFKTWIFPNIRAQSAAEPVQSGSTWMFAPGSRVNGEVSVEALADLSSCALPTAE